MPEPLISPEDIQLICSTIEKSASGPLLAARNFTIGTIRAELGVVKERAKIAESALKRSHEALSDAQSENTRLSQIAPLKGTGVGDLLDEIEALGWARPVLKPASEVKSAPFVIPERAKLSYDPDRVDPSDPVSA